MHNKSAFTKIFLATAVLSLTAACSGTKSTTVAELTEYDKHMNCTELQLEITEASFLRDKAERNRGLSIKNVVMPLSYPSTYMSSGNAVDAASNRIEYLSRLSEVKGCNAQQQYASAEGQVTPPPAAYGQPMPQYAPQYAAPQQQGAYQQMRYAQPPQGYGAAPQYQARPSYSY